MSAVYIEDFKQYGVKQAGQHGGNFESYKGILDKFHSGELVKDGDLRVKTDAEKSKIQDQINRLSHENARLIGEINKLHHRADPNKGLIPIKKNQIDEIQGEIDLFLTNGAKQKHRQLKTFSLSTFLTYLIFLIPLSIYLLFFYTSVAHSAFYGLDPMALVNGDRLSVPILPNFQDLVKALRTNYMLIVIPSVFFGFGVVLHILFGIKGKIKFLYLFLLILVTFVADGFLAYKIHEQAILGLQMILDEGEITNFIELIWYRDINFYLVLIMGFIVFLMWSIIFHHLNLEWSKRDVVKIRQKIIERLKKEIQEHLIEINNYESQIDHNNVAIDNLKEKRDKEIIGSQTMENNINEFSDGWNMFLSTLYDGEADDYISQVNIYKKEFFASVTNLER